MRAACVLGLFLVLLQLSHSLLLGAFNIRSFGDTKASNVTLMNIISKVCKRFFYSTIICTCMASQNIINGQGYCHDQSIQNEMYSSAY